jgi:predicted RNase H-like HicB family nuclease
MIGPRMATLVEEIEVVGSTLREVAREPLAPRAEGPTERLILELDALLGSPELAKVRQLSSRQRVPIARMFQSVADTLRQQRDAGEEVERRGGHAPWARGLAEAVGRMERQLKRRGLPLRPTKAPPPTVFRDPATGEFRLKEQIAAIEQARDAEIDAINAGLAAALRDNALEQYITVAVQAARLSKFEEDEGWFAEIDGFPGVWADGATSEAALATLAEVLRDWLKIKLSYQDPDIPVVANIDLAALARGA